MFTTVEGADFATSLVVRNKSGTLTPFSRDRLFISILRSVGHRKDSLSAANALAATIMARLLQDAETAAIKSSDITAGSLHVLKRFDKAAAVQYAAYHKD